ncbi:MAG: type II toxin-antitoxin system prevent-host-death family antitoxin [Desulfobacterales bacterium]
MKAITYTAARQNLAKTMEKVCQDHAPIIVTRKTSDSVVIMSLEDYEALEETAYLLRSPKNARRLIESIAQLEEGRGSERAGEIRRLCFVNAALIMAAPRSRAALP